MKDLSAVIITAADPVNAGTYNETLTCNHGQTTITRMTDDPTMVRGMRKWAAANLEERTGCDCLSRALDGLET